jgi:hypothetical protein
LTLASPVDRDFLFGRTGIISQTASAAAEFLKFPIARNSSLLSVLKRQVAISQPMLPPAQQWSAALAIRRDAPPGQSAGSN